MSAILPCTDWRDAMVISPSQNFYLKPLASISISVQLPADMLKTAGISVSTRELMEKIKTTAKPDEFIGMKVLKSTPQYVRFEAHLDSKHQVSEVLQRLDRVNMNLNGCPEPLKIRACESTLIYPSRHDWDTYFQQSKNMNEEIPGERPDTVYVSMLPVQWFMVPQSYGVETNNSKMKPSETMVRTLFEVFGPLRSIDIPMLDPYRPKIVHNYSNTSSFGHDGLFEAYIQYQEYGGFVKCMNAFRGMKFLYKEGNKAWTALVQVDFDRTKHQSDRSIKYRKVARERLIQEEIDRERADKVRRELETLKHEESRRQQTEERLKEEEEIARKKKSEEEARVILEERKLVLVQRRLESLRLLEAVFDRVKATIEESEKRKKDPSKKRDKSKKDKETKRQQKLEEKERTLRAKLLKKYQQLEQKQFEDQREKVRQMLQTSQVAPKLKSTTAEPKSSDRFAPSPISPGENSPHPRKGEIERSNNEEAKHDTGTRYKATAYRPHGSQPNDWRKGEHGNFQGQNYHNRYQHQQQPFHRKRFQSNEPFHSTRQDQNRADWKRSRFEGGGKSNWVSDLDQELWDGPNVEFQRQNARGGFRRGSNWGDHQGRRLHDNFPPMKEKYNGKSEFRNPTSVAGDHSMEQASVPERPT